jgi:transcriptional regulator with XRE-family HTH domain
MVTAAPPHDSNLGDALRFWRSLRRMSQLNLAAEAQTTPRYISFIETGRSKPTRQMVDRLADALNIPLRERNALMLAAGYAPSHRESALDEAGMERINQAFDTILESHLPYPAIVMDRRWNVVRANTGAQHLFGALLSPEPVPADANVLKLMLEPGPVLESVVNWPAVATSLLRRIRAEAIGGVTEPDTASLVEGLQTRNDNDPTVIDPSSAPVVDITFCIDADDLSFFSVISTIGTPLDITAQELRLEAFFPANDKTSTTWSAWYQDNRDGSG